MSYFQSLLNSNKLENGLVWSSIFTVSTMPVGYIANSLILPRFKLSLENKDILGEQVLKLLFGTSAIIGFLYGFNTTRRISNKN